MTAEDAEKVAAILVTVDGGCPVCVEEALRAFAEAFPGFDSVLDAAWAAEFPGTWRKRKPEGT